MARLLKNPNAAQLMGFLRRIKKLVGKVGVGDTLMLPLIVEGSELLLLLIRKSDKYYDMVVVATDPELALRHHAVNAAAAPCQQTPGTVAFRTCLVVPGIEKKMATDDVFWAAVFNLTSRSMGKETTGDMHRFYDLLLPFITGKPLEQTLVEVELAAQEASTSAVPTPDAPNHDVDHADAPNPNNFSPGETTNEPVKSESDSSQAAAAAAAAAATAGTTAEGHPPAAGAWRLPQRSSTAYVRCVLEALHFLLTSRGLSDGEANCVQLALQAQLVEMVANDMMFELPDENGRRVCEMALSSFSDASVRVAADISAEAAAAKAVTTATAAPEMPTDEKTCAAAVTFAIEVPEATRARVLQLGADLLTCAEDVESLPPYLDLTGLRNGTLQPEAPLSSESTGAGADTAVTAAATQDLDPALMQFRDHLMWEVEDNIPDPGQAVTLRKYEPIDLLQLPEKASTRAQAVDALRLCDRQCALLFNQSHCIKNVPLLVVTLIEHVFTQVIAVPKPRPIPAYDAKRDRRAKAAEARRSEREAKEAAETAARAAAWNDFKAGKGKRPDSKESNSAAAGGAYSSSSRPNSATTDAEAHSKNSDKSQAKSANAMEEAEASALDRTAGDAAEVEATTAACYWDAPLTYALQVELMLTVGRLAECFTAAAMSLQHSRSFDAVCMVVPGVMAAVSDALLRQLASDRPSELSACLLGCTTNGRQLGVAGFGTSAGTFAAQSETMEIHYPELAVARTAVLDYFNSPQQRRLEKVFDWEANFELKPTRSLVKMVRHLCRATAMADPRPHMLLCDYYPDRSLLLKNYPELRAFRDIVFWWKFHLNADVKAFPNYTPPDSTNEIGTFDRLQAQLRWNWDEEEKGYQVQGLNYGQLRCRPDPRARDPVTGRQVPPELLPTHRYPSTATPGFYLGKPTVRTEDDVIYRPNLPGFELAGVAGQILSQRDSELLISFLTVPYLRLPLVLAFFASDDRVHKLQSPKLKGILDSVVFEPGHWLATADTGVLPQMVPTQHTNLLASAYGLFTNELHRAPHNVLGPMSALLTGALALDTGAVCDVGGEDFNTGVDIILYVTRLASRVDNFVSFLVDHRLQKHRCLSDAILREVSVDQACLETLQTGLMDLRRKLHGEVSDLLEEYLLKLDRETAAAPGDEKLIDRNSRLACDLHAHRLLLLRNLHQDELTVDRAKVLVGSFVFLTTRHTWNKSARKGGQLLVPETEIYELLTVTRRRLITWPRLQRQGDLDHVLQTALQISSSTTGSLRASAAVLDAGNRWSIIGGVHSVGRFAIASTRTVKDEEEGVEGKDKATHAGTESAAVASAVHEKNSGGEANDGTEAAKLSTSAASALAQTASEEAQSAVEVVADTGLLGCEIDVQIGQMTLRSKHLSALESAVANHPDVKLIFGDATMQASLLERAEHRSRYRLVGLGHELDHWKTPHDSLPPLSDPWERPYDPSELGESEGWVAKLFEPLRKAFFNGPSPPPMQFMLPEQSLPKHAEVATLLGLHPGLGGPFKLVVLFRSFKCAHVYECVTQGRQWWYTLHLTTDARYSLRDLQPSIQPRQAPSPKWWQHGSGAAYPRGTSENVYNDVVGVSQNPEVSVLVHRDASDSRNLSGGVETLVPSRFLLGVVPQVIQLTSTL